jgi:hypothetical protein
MKTHRSRLRARGLRPIQIRVPDVRAASFRREAHRQSLAVAASAAAADDQAFIDAVSDEIDRLYAARCSLSAARTGRSSLSAGPSGFSITGPSLASP